MSFIFYTVFIYGHMASTIGVRRGYAGYAAAYTEAL